MAEEIIFKARVDTGNSVKNVNELDKAVKSTSNSVNELGKSTVNARQQLSGILNSTASFEDKLKQLDKVVKETPVSIRDMNKQIQAYQSLALEAGRTSPIGQQALAQAAALKDRYVDIQNETKRLSNDHKNLAGVMQLGQTVVAGWGAAQASMALMGKNTEELQKSMAKLMAITTILNSLNQIKVALEKESNLTLFLNNALTKSAAVAQGIYTVAVGNSTGALKAFRVALLATGIGAVIAGIGLLIANWDSLTEALGFATKEQQLYNDVAKEAIKSISGELSAANKLSKVLKDETTTREDKVQAVKDLQAEYPNLLANVDAEKMSLDEINEALELNTELLKLNAQVKALESLRSEQYEKQLQAEVDAQTGANEGLINSIQALSFGVDAKEFANQKSRAAQREAQKEIDAYDELEKSLNKQIKALTDRGAVGEKEAKDAAARAEEEKKAADERAKRAEEYARKQEELRQRQIEREQLMEDIMIQNINDESLRRLEQLRVGHERERQQLVEKYGQDTELLKQLRIKQDQEITALNAELAQKEADALAKIKADEKAANQAIIDENLRDEKARLEARLIQLENDFNAEQELKKELAFNEMLTALQNEKLTEGEKLKIRAEYAQKIKEIDDETAQHGVQVEQEANQKRWEIYQNASNSIQNLADTVFSIRMAQEQEGSAEYEKLAKKQFKINKAMQLGNAIIDGYKAVTASLSQSPIAIGPIPNPAGIASLAFAGSTSLANIAKIAATQYKGSSSASGGVTPPSIPSPTGGNESFGTSTLTAGLQGSGQNQPNKVVLVDSELKAQQEKTNKIEIISTIG